MAKKSSNNLANLLLNIVIPTVILMKFSAPEYLGPTTGLLVALTFPFAYGIYEYRQKKEFNLFSIIGIISVFLTGGIGLLQLDPKYVAIKEAGVPLLLAGAILFFHKKYPFVKKLLHEVIDHKRVYQALHEQEAVDAYEKRLRNGNYLIVLSFLLSAALNFTLAKMIVVSQPGTTEFNAELGRLTALSYPVIALPSMVLMAVALTYVLFGIRKLAKLEINDIMKNQ